MRISTNTTSRKDLAAFLAQHIAHLSVAGNALIIEREGAALVITDELDELRRDIREERVVLLAHTADLAALPEITQRHDLTIILELAMQYASRGHWHKGDWGERSATHAADRWTLFTMEGVANNDLA